MQYNVFAHQDDQENLIPEPEKKGHEHSINRKPGPVYPQPEDKGDQAPIDFASVDTGKSVFNIPVSSLTHINSFEYLYISCYLRNPLKHTPITMCLIQTGLQPSKASRQLLH